MSGDSGDVETNDERPDSTGAEDGAPRLFKLVASASLAFDLITGCIGLFSLLRETALECCGSEAEIPRSYTWVSLGQIALVAVEIFPVIFRRMLWMTAANPFLGLIVTAGLLYSSNREEAIAALFFELSAVAMNWYTLKFIEGKRFCCSLHVFTLIPTILSLYIGVYYLSEAGACVATEKFETSDGDGGGGFHFRLGGTSHGVGDCLLCGADGLPWTPDCGPNFIDRGESYYGTYCGDEAEKFCFFPN